MKLKNNSLIVRIKEFQSLPQSEQNKFCSYCGCTGGCNLCTKLPESKLNGDLNMRIDLSLDCFKNYDCELSDTITGGVLFLTSKDKKYSASIYWYDDEEPGVLYLSNIIVIESERMKGLGNNLLLSLQEICKTIGGKQIMLSCNNKKFVYNWYKRNGFNDVISDNKHDIGWMVKNI